MAVLSKNFDFIGIDRHVRVKETAALSIGVTFYEADKVTPKDLTGRTFGAQVINDAGTKLQDFTPDVTEYLSGKITFVLDLSVNTISPGRYTWEAWETVDRIYVTGGDFVVEASKYV